jgi:hypothetical protein
MLRESIWRKRAELWPKKRIFHYDNDLEHDVSWVDKFLPKKSITRIDNHLT